MSDGSFTKLFSSITASTIWCEPNHVRIVWITMLSMSDQHGHVAASIPGLAAIARVSVDECRQSIKLFLSPDRDSRTKAHEGRRIEEIDGGWKLLNYAFYREKIDKENRREYQAEWAKNKRKSNNVDTDVDKHRQNSTQAEAEAEADINTNTSMSPPAIKPPKVDPVPYEKIISLYHQYLPKNPVCQMLTAKRKASIGVRWRSGVMATLDDWTQYFKHCSTSEWLTGQCDPSPGRKRFVADIDFLINENNIVKIAENKYHGKG